MNNIRNPCCIFIALALNSRLDDVETSTVVYTIQFQLHFLLQAVES